MDVGDDGLVRAGRALRGRRRPARRAHSPPRAARSRPGAPSARRRPRPAPCRRPCGCSIRRSARHRRASAASRHQEPGQDVRDARRVELEEEQVAAFGLVGLADRRGHLAETAQRPEEPTVGRLGPADVAAPPPTVGAQGVEPTVVADAVRRVPLDRVATEIAERRPRIEESRRTRGDRGDARRAARPRAAPAPPRVGRRRRRPAPAAPWSEGRWTCGSAGRSRRAAYRRRRGPTVSPRAGARRFGQQRQLGCGRARTQPRRGEEHRPRRGDGVRDPRDRRDLGHEHDRAEGAGRRCCS